MGRVRRGGYYIVWWIGDHSPRHVHVFDSADRFLGRVAIPSGEALDEWKPTRKVLQIIAQLIKEGRL
jgi:hypothetical protein